MRVIGGYIKNQWQRQSNLTLNLKYGQMPKQTTNENHCSMLCDNRTEITN